MFEPNLTIENATRFSRLDVDHLLSSASPHPIFLDEREWPSCEHYYQANIVRSAGLIKRIIESDSAQAAFDLGSPWYRKKIENWKEKRKVLMTRALYTKVQMYDEVRQFLFETQDELLVETALYDYFFGVGRDNRGENQMGKVWMDIRKKLREDAA